MFWHLLPFSPYVAESRLVESKVVPDGKLVNIRMTVETKHFFDVEPIKAQKHSPENIGKLSDRELSRSRPKPPGPKLEDRHQGLETAEETSRRREWGVASRGPSTRAKNTPARATIVSAK